MSKKRAIPPEKFDLYEKLIMTNPKLEVKGATTAYTSLNGHMFSFMDKGGNMGLRLPKESRERFLEDYDSELMVQYGSVMKEYVVVPDDLLQDTAKLKEYLEMSYAYIETLKPKPTTRKKKDS